MSAVLSCSSDITRLNRSLRAPSGSTMNCSALVASNRLVNGNHGAFGAASASTTVSAQIG